MHRQSETRAGNHRRHTRTRNASLPTQANHTARGARKQPPNQGAIHAFCLLVPLQPTGAQSTLQRDATLRKAEASRNKRRKPPKAHTYTINASALTEAHSATRATNSNPPARPLHMHLTNTPGAQNDASWSHLLKTNTPHTHHTAPCATEAPPTNTAARQPSRARQGPAQRTYN